MASQSEKLTWDVSIFEDCYNAVKFLDSIPEQIDDLIGADLRLMLVVPSRSDSSRQTLTKAENEPIAFSDGLKYKLNKPFIESAYLLATELNLDELATAELLQLATQVSFSKGSILEDAGLLAFFRRYDYILNIVGYMVTHDRVKILFPTQNPAEKLLQQCFASLKTIYSLVQIQNDQIDKQKATADLNDLAFVKRISFVKQQLFQTHELVCQILYFIVDAYPETLAKYETYDKIVKHISEAIPNDSDILLLHYLPSLLRVATAVEEMPEAEVQKFHQQFSSTLSADFQKIKENDSLDLSKSSLRPYDLCARTFFFIAVIPWCKVSAARTGKYDFKKDILQYIEWLISYGIMEQLLSYSAETAVSETVRTLEQSETYDFRNLLQRACPRLWPAKFAYQGHEELSHAAKLGTQYANLAQLCDFSGFKISNSISEDLLAPLFHTFFSGFVNHAAIVLTSLRDSEEDFLLSSGPKEIDGPSGGQSTFSDTHEILASRSMLKLGPNNGNDLTHDLNDIAARADLERFYLACVYTYSNRAELCEAFWATDESNVAGFIDWGISKNTLPLITAAFSILLGSLTSNGTAGSLKVWDILMNANTFRKNDYSYISIDSIIGSLTYYLDALSDNLKLDLLARSKIEQHKLEYLFSNNHSKRNIEEEAETSIELSDDSLVFIAGFLMLISQIVKNLGDDSPVSQSLRQTAFNHFHPLLVSFLKFDNLTTSAKGYLNRQSKVISALFDEEDRTVIINLVLHCLENFAATEDLTIRNKIWNTIDRWICHSLHDDDTVASGESQGLGSRPSLTTAVTNTSKTELQKIKNFYKGLPMKQCFGLALTKTSEVLNFVSLLATLLKPSSLKEFGFKSLKLLYSSDIGSGYRFKNQIGVWPYVEYVLTEVFPHTPDIDDEDARIGLQKLVLSIVKNSLQEVDWKFVISIAPQIFLQTPTNEEFFTTSSLQAGEAVQITLETFVRLHHSLGVMNFLLDEKPSSVLFSVLNTGIEVASVNPVMRDLVSDAILIVDEILKLQGIYNEKLLPFLTNTGEVSQNDAKKPAGYGTSLSIVLSTPKTTYDNIYYPSGLGSHAVTDFYELILFNLSSVVHIALYVGSDEEIIAHTAISILKKLANSPFFSSKSLLSKDIALKSTRLLSIFENVDESLKIRYAFVQQMESISESLTIKFDILEFLLANLPETGNITVAHFLLGFDTRSGSPALNEKTNKLSLLDSLTTLLLSTIDLVSEIDYTKGYVTGVGFGPSKLASLIMQILVRLCKNPVVSSNTLKHIRNYDLSSRLLQSHSKIDESTIWQNKKFQGDLRDGFRNEFIEDDISVETFFEFLKFRNLCLQYLSVEVHEIRSSMVKEQYVKQLLDDTEFFNGTPKIMNFLDVLNYQLYNFEAHKLLELEKTYNLHGLVQEMKEGRENKGPGIELLSNLASLRCQFAYQKFQNEDEKSAFSIDVMKEMTGLDETLHKVLAVEELKTQHLHCLQSWAQIIQVLSSNGVADRAEFILKVFQYILPKINNDYYERDIMFAEELVSLCMLLFDIYDEATSDQKQDSDPSFRGQHLQKLLPLFKTCVNGVVCSDSTPALRSDLYVLLNKFTLKSPRYEPLLSQIVAVLRSVDRKFIDVICNDLIYSEGAPRITLIILMETLVHLSGLEQSSAILDAIVENNSLSLLARLLKRTGELFEACEGSVESGITVDTLLYELTAFKATLYLLIRIAQTRDGASQLFQNEIFSIIRSLKFLNIEADLGTHLQIETEPLLAKTRSSAYISCKDEHATALIKLKLDVPVLLADPAKSGKQEQLHTVSYYEFLVPVFQLVCSVLLLMGPLFKPGILQARELMQHFRGLVLGIMKRDQLMEDGEVEQYQENEKLSLAGLRQLAKLFVLVDAFVSDERSAV